MPLPDSILVIGHRNPDTDAVASAVGYAWLLNSLGGDKYVAGRTGQLNAQTAFALQRFDPIGAWDAGADAKSEWQGRPFDGPAGFKGLIAQDPHEFTRGFIEHLLSYAINRPLEVYDMPVVETIEQAAKADGWKFSRVIVEIVKSYPFNHVRQTLLSVRIRTDRSVRATGHCYRSYRRNWWSQGEPIAAHIVCAFTSPTKESSVIIGFSPVVCTQTPVSLRGKCDRCAS